MAENPAFEKIAEGFVSMRQPGTPTAIAGGPRCAVTREKEIICTFMAQSKLGINDFKPMLARSRNGGTTWTEPRLLWPHLESSSSLFGAVSRAPGGDLFFYGSIYKIDMPGESIWSDATQGLKENELFWSRSADNGANWTDPRIIPMPIPGSAETAMAMCITRAGRWVCCYSPYPTFDPKIAVDRNQVVALSSDDQGEN